MALIKGKKLTAEVPQPNNRKKQPRGVTPPRVGHQPLIVDLNKSEERSRFSGVQPVNVRFAVEHKTATMERQPGSWNMPEMLTAKELEALLKIDVKTIYTYVQRGLIPYVRIQSNVRFPKQQILVWIEEHNFLPRPMNGKRPKAP